MMRIQRLCVDKLLLLRTQQAHTDLVQLCRSSCELSLETSLLMFLAAMSWVQLSVHVESLHNQVHWSEHIQLHDQTTCMVT